MPFDCQQEKTQPIIQLQEKTLALTPEQFCIVLQASRETARLMEAGATVEDIARMQLSSGCPIGGAYLTKKRL